jgi:hypothetical protein
MSGRPGWLANLGIHSRLEVFPVLLRRGDSFHWKGTRAFLNDVEENKQVPRSLVENAIQHPPMVAAKLT